jgi:hypothetical protein
MPALNDKQEAHFQSYAEKTATAVGSLQVHKMNDQQDCLTAFQTLSSESILMACLFNAAPVLYYTHLKIHPITMTIIIENSHIGHYARRL